MIKTVEEAFNILADKYDHSFSNPTDEAENQLIFSLIKSYLNPQKKILDLGCGTGLILDYIKISPDNYLGIDVSDEMILIANTKHPGHSFKIRDMAQLDGIASKSYDMIISLFGSFSYCMEPVKCLLNIKRILKPNGIIILMPMYERILSGKEIVLSNNFNIEMIPWTKRMITVFMSKRFIIEKSFGFSWKAKTKLGLWAEMNTIGKLLSSLCHFQVVIGRKNAKTDHRPKRI